MTQRPNSQVSWAHPIRAVAFDMDGLLVNTEELYTQVGSILLQRRGRQFSQELKDAMTGLPGPQAFQIMIDREGLASDTIEALTVESRNLFEEILPKRLALLDGVQGLLESLDRRALPKCVATSSSSNFARSVLKQVAIADRFDFVITVDDVSRGKPHPDIYLAAARRMNVPPEQMMVLEDSHNGARAGVTSGACTIAVPGPHSVDHDFTGTAFRATPLRDPVIFEMFER